LLDRLSGVRPRTFHRWSTGVFSGGKRAAEFLRQQEKEDLALALCGAEGNYSGTNSVRLLVKEWR
jgi:hypothetical protein